MAGEQNDPFGETTRQREAAPEYRKVSGAELKAIVQAHEQWVESEGKTGWQGRLSRANLQRARLDQANLQGVYLMGANLQGAYLNGANLQGAELYAANLQGAHLRFANLKGAELHSANLQGVNLEHANLRGADLCTANLKGADLGGAELRDANLQDADLTGAKGLQAQQLGGANVSGAKLEDNIKSGFKDGLAGVQEASKNARKLFVTMLLACAYSLLTIATTTDLRLILNAGTSELPIIRTQVPIVWFYLAAPPFLLGVFVYFHLYMQRLWEGLSKLPAVFPDGRELDEKAYPWLLVGLTRAHVPLLRKAKRKRFLGLQNFVAVVLGWAVTPFTLYMFWVRHIPKHDWRGTGLHLSLVALSAFFAFRFYRAAVDTLAGKPGLPDLSGVSPRPAFLQLFRKKLIDTIATFRKWRTYTALTATAAIVWFVYLSFAAISGEERILPIQLIGYRPYADLRSADLSQKLEDWPEDSTAVRGAELAGVNLRFADLEEAFLMKATLRGANLWGADLRAANLQGADLFGAKLQDAYLGWANLQDDSLGWANLQDAYLGYANLQDADLRYANLQDADLRGANLQGATLWAANLQGAILRAANLQGATLRAANLQDANLAAANLQDAYLVDANLQGATLLSVRGTPLLERANLYGIRRSGTNLDEWLRSGAVCMDTERLDSPLTWVESARNAQAEVAPYLDGALNGDSTAIRRIRAFCGIT